MIVVYGAAGCAPYEVTKLFLQIKGADFTLIDPFVEEKRRQLGELGSLTRGVILDHLTEMMQGVSARVLERPYRAHRQREG